MKNRTSDDPTDSNASQQMDALKGASKKYAKTTWEWFSFNPDAGMEKLGIGWKALAKALVLTCVTYMALNLALSWRVDRAWGNARYEELGNSLNTSQRVEALLKASGSDPKLATQHFVTEPLRSDQEYGNCRNIIVETINIIQSTASERDESQSGSSELEEVLDDYMTGQRRGWPWFAYELKPISGRSTIDALRKVSPNWERTNETATDASLEISAEEIDTYLANLIDRAAQENRGSLRSLMRLSGGIQWLTILVCWMVIVLCNQRKNLLTALSRDHPSAFQERNEEVIERQVFNSLEYLIGILPTLGFIGTVLGMGDALLTADGLFSASDKSHAIGVITSHLGFAFDTTLLGLLTGIIASAFMLRLRLWESSFSVADSGKLPVDAPLEHRK